MLNNNEVNIMDNETIKQAVQMRKAHLNLIKWALNEGCAISVYCEGDNLIEDSTKYTDIKEHTESVDIAELVFKKDGKRKGWALIVFGNEDDELVSDHTANEWMESWWTQYNKMYEATQ